MGSQKNLISVHNLKKSFKVLKKDAGVLGALKALVSADYKIIEAVKGISFDIGRGEMVGYVGPNGAGKSTTIKMLSGILYPDSGTISVAGVNPFRDRKKYAMKLGVMFGQRTQLWWDLPVSESFDLLKSIYRIDNKRYSENIEYFNFLLKINEFWSQPVRRLSLGQRVRADLAASLLHDPEVLLLDEPTIGLDVLARDAFRMMIKGINNDRKTTVLLTSHDLGDIEMIAQRLILIDLGEVLYDGSLAGFMKKYSHLSRVTIQFQKKDKKIDFPKGVSLIESGSNRVLLEVDTRILLYKDLLNLIPRWGDVKDIHMELASLEEILSQIYRH